MAFEVKIIADSLAPCGKRLTTIEATYPRFIHGQVLTHRDRVRNAASSRAIRFPVMTERIELDPVVPILWGMEKPGMQTGEEIPEYMRPLASQIWLEAMCDSVKHAKRLHNIGISYAQDYGKLEQPEDIDIKIHKSIPNRLLEPWAWITVVMTATEWSNFFRLRCHPDAEIHFQKIAVMIRDAINESEPKPKHANQWHMPFIEYEDTLAAYTMAEDRLESYLEILRNVSVARCARVSYLTHDGKRDLKKDLELFDKLCNGSGYGHWSPHEHVAQATDDAKFRSGPFLGWKQYRKMFPNENG